MRSQAEEGALAELISVALERIDRGEEVRLEELCADRPELEAPLRRALERSGLVLALRSGAGRDPWVGKTLADRYELQGPLGSGAMGVVYAGIDRRLDRPVAVKLLRGSVLSTLTSEKRFHREAEALAAVSHPAVVTIYDRGSTEGEESYLVMERLHGLSLADLLQRAVELQVEPLEERAGWVAETLESPDLSETNYLRLVAGWVADIAEGLAAAHAQGIFHRDVKPSNVFLRRDGTPTLLDFGLAARAAAVDLTEEGSTVGTPAYMPPESLDPAHRADARSDVYSLTATLYHLLTLRPPYSGTPGQVLAHLMVREVVPAQKIQPGLPRDLIAILDRGLARRPSDRYPDATRLADDLRAFLEHRPVSARPLPGIVRLWRRARGSSALRAIAALLLLGLLVWGGREARAAWSERRLDTHLGALAQLPPALALTRPGCRAFSPIERPEHVEALLDRAVDTADEALPSRLVRALFLFDQGRRQDALGDLTYLAQDLGGEFVEAFRAAYAAVVDSPDQSPDTSQLPEPTRPEEHYIAAFQAIRDERNGQVGAHLAEDAARGYLPLVELGVPSLNRQPIQMYEQAIEVEQQIGRRTATTAHLIGLALVHQKRYEDALDVIADGLELCPTGFGLHLNGGTAAWRLNRSDQAIASWHRAIELKPLHPKAYQNLVRLYLSDEDLESAADALGRVPDDLAATEEAMFVGLEAELACVRAMLLFRSGQRESGMREAERSVELFEHQRELAGKATAARFPIARAYADGDEGTVFALLAEFLRESPALSSNLRVLRESLPARLDEPQVAALQEYLEALESELRPRENALLLDSDDR